MKKSALLLSLCLGAAFALSGCGDDNKEEKIADMKKENALKLAALEADVAKAKKDAADAAAKAAAAGAQK